MASCTVCKSKFPLANCSTTLSAFKLQAATCKICCLIYNGIESSLQDSNLLHDDDIITLDNHFTLLDVKKNGEPHYLVEFFTVPGTKRSEPPAEFDHLHHSLPVPSDPLSDECLKKLNQWINNCNHSHTDCHSGNSSSLPTRVINIGSEDGSTKPFLHISKGEIGNYVALSHCWGITGPPLKTTRGNLSSRTSGIEWLDLPKSFQDAITVTRLLGLRYLWIDSLCILQGDVDDWVVASSQMAAIYKNAYLVLSATSAAGSQVGFLSSRPTTNIFRVEPKKNGELPYTVLARPAISHANFLGAAFQEDERRHPNFTAFTRAWCFQERIMATRVVHFSKSEVVFECKQGSWCECGFLDGKRFSYKSEHHSFIHDRRGYPIEDLWKDLTRLYTGLDLTYKTDVLPALSGIAESMGQLQMGDYLAGLWTGSLLQLLMWRSVRVEECRRPSDVYLAPTFSWASRVGPIMYPSFTGRPTRLSETFVTILDAKCVPTSENNVYGSVSSGFLKLRGFLFSSTLRFGPVFYQKMALRKERSNDYIFFGADLPKGFSSLWDHEDAGDPVVEIDTVDDLKGVTSRSEVHFLPIARWDITQSGGGICCLILKLCEDKKRFKRIGISLWGLYRIDFHGKQDEDIIII